LKSSCLTSSEMGTWILIFCISCSKLKEERGFRVSLTSRKEILTIGEGFYAFLPLLLSATSSAEVFALVGY
jgi:hypothetical protein